ncbi:Holliday junction-specific endonuclease [Paucilactobacillus oligofermentans DSM 15707 = LMG 22743]|uniref:Holliday junction resolvase RecU n=1 Tax=Paucilactobacillus oligofermentans DSM 15707 = LMG 22743 TaxID=1423778 RepID=A0A0R1RJ81_9LACO|nr:Holliday junction resolvase RecU [Paucilactobacillus oligofermentans]KRL54874.1 Holliday junction-specific endonuclease [Paucilactobacillus oligofermentans DSM 15707 = LMG 22743]CUS26211.1 Holliday junction resolvase RecU [Paucilactobacillus oligofermentans DSM 15707 = LMG 22743]
MPINYPNGNHYNFKNKSVKSIGQTVNYAKRGMSLEEEINESNEYYLSRGIAVIHKKPTPVQLVKVDYPKRSAAVIKEAYFRKASTTDYNGVYKGYYLDFDAKETKNKTSFPLYNFHEHQINHLKACIAQGGICFAFLKFTSLNELYLLPATKLFEYWDQQDTSKKSITLKEIKEFGYSLTYQFNPVIPYLDAVDKIIENSIH